MYLLVLQEWVILKADLFCTGDSKSTTANGKDDDGAGDDSKDDKDVKSEADSKKVSFIYVVLIFLLSYLTGENSG